MPSAPHAPASDNTAVSNALDGIASFYDEHMPTLGLEGATLLLRMNTWAVDGVIEMSYSDIAGRMGWSRNHTIKHLGILQREKLVKRLPVLLSRPNRWSLSAPSAYGAPGVTSSAPDAPEVSQPVAKKAVVSRVAQAIDPLLSEEEKREETVSSLRSDTVARSKTPARRAASSDSDRKLAEFEAWLAAEDEKHPGFTAVFEAVCAISRSPKWRLCGAEKRREFAQFARQLMREGDGLDQVSLFARRYRAEPLRDRQTQKPIPLSLGIVRDYWGRYMADDWDAEHATASAPARAAPPQRASVFAAYAEENGISLEESDEKRFSGAKILRAV